MNVSSSLLPDCAALQRGIATVGPRGHIAAVPHLHFGEISPRQVWHAATGARQDAARSGVPRDGQFLTELGWREFAHHLLYHHPHSATRPLRREFDHFPWADDEEALHAWQQGRTGIPIVDAGMRQLWHEGWMHNRVRMIAASLLVKNLQVNWLHGARWFWDTLVDADLACNTLGWQWVAGSGADAAPFFRIFNPESQRAKFDRQVRTSEVGRRGRGCALYPEAIVNSADVAHRRARIL